MPYHDKGSKGGGGEDQQKTQEQQIQRQERDTEEQLSNPIVQVDLNASPGEWKLQTTGEEYVGIYHLHEDGTAMAGLGQLGESHEIMPEKVIVQQLLEEDEPGKDTEGDVFSAEDTGEYEEWIEPESPTLTTATPNEFTEFITIKEYNWLVERVENVSTFLSTFFNLFSFNGHVAGGYLRRVIKSGDAFQFQDADLDFWFQTSDDLFGAVHSVNQGNLTQFYQPDVLQEIEQDKYIYSWDLISKTNNFPNIKLQLIASYVGDIENILSSYDFTNAKIATNLNQVAIDGRWDSYENNNFVNIDIVKSSIISRLLKYLYSEGEQFRLNGASALKFLSWVGSIVESSETNSVTLSHMESLYNVLLNANQVDYETISFMKDFLSELSFPSLEDLTNPNLPLNVSSVPSQTQQQETQGTSY